MALWLIALLLLTLVLANPAARKILLGFVGLAFYLVFWLGLLALIAAGLFYWLGGWAEVAGFLLVCGIVLVILAWTKEERQKRYERSAPPVLPVFNHLDPFSAQSQRAVARLREIAAQSKKDQEPPRTS
jgi:hypothetical protein